MREYIVSIFSLMHILSDIWKELEKGRFPLVNFGNNRKREALMLPVFSNPRRALYKRVECSEKRDQILNKIVNENPSLRAHRKSSSSPLSFSLSHIHGFLYHTN